MKGTLFSADFVRDGAGDHKLLEINTDTACIDNLVSNLDFSGLYTVLSDNSITDLQVIFKQFHKPIIERLEAQKPGGVTITKHQEQISAVFPSVIADSADKFILRLAYDENALLDVVYAKSDANLHGLFHEAGNDSASLCAPLAFDDGAGNSIDSLNNKLNGSTEPDFVVKPAVPTKSGLSFYKLGGSSGSVEDRVSEFKSSIDLTTNIITNYVHDGSDTAKSVRSYQVVYGADLDICWLGEYQIDAIFTHTEELSHDDSKVVNLLPNKHYFEFATNDISDYEGIHYEENIKIEAGGYHAAEDAVIGTLYDSFYVSGSPMTDNSLVLDSWSFDGGTIPSGSHSSASVLQSNTTVTVASNGVRKLTLADGTSVLLGGANRALAYDNVNDKTSYLRARDINVGFTLFDADGNSKAVTAHDIQILENDSDAKVVELGVEDVDNYIVSSSNTIIHNAPCFVGETPVAMADGSQKMIKDIKEGEIVACWDFENNRADNGPVLVKTEKEVQEVYELKIEATDHDSIIIYPTLDHPFYVKDEGWACFDPALLKEKTGMEAIQLKAGDVLFTGKEDFLASVISTNTIDDGWRPTVYNLDNVENFNNFFVYGVLVHNRWIFACHTFDSKVELSNGSFKAIGDIKIGDKVKSIKDGISTEGTVTDHITHKTNDVMRVVKTANGYVEINHPILTKEGEWIPAGELGEHESLFVDNFYNLEIDGNEDNSDHNFIVDGLVSSGLGDNAKLNAKYQRQPKQLTNHL